MTTPAPVLIQTDRGRIHRRGSFIMAERHARRLVTRGDAEGAWVYTVPDGACLAEVYLDGAGAVLTDLLPAGLAAWNREVRG